MQFVVMGFQLGVHDGFHLVGVGGAQRQESKIVAKKDQGMVVVGEARELLEQSAFVRAFHVAFQGQVALGLGQLENRIEHAQQFQVAVLVVARPLQQRSEHLGGGRQDRFRIADDEGTDTGAEDDDELERLPKNVEVTAWRGVTADDASHHDDGADDKKHP